MALKTKNFPHFPAAWPLDRPTTAQQVLIAAKIAALTDWGTPPPIVDDMIELLDWYDGDADFEDEGCAEDVGDELDEAWLESRTVARFGVELGHLPGTPEDAE